MSSIVARLNRQLGAVRVRDGSATRRRNAERDKRCAERKARLLALLSAPGSSPGARLAFITTAARLGATVRELRATGSHARHDWNGHQPEIASYAHALGGPDLARVVVAALCGGSTPKRRRRAK